jgi:hypothetical protein
VDKDLRKEIGKYFIDISKLLFGGIVLATILKIETISKLWLVISGLLVSAIFAIAGFVIMNRKNINKAN